MRPNFHKKIARVTLEIGGYVIATLLLLEITLQLFPSLIPLPILNFMGEEVRASIATRRKLATEADHANVARDDGGPALKIRRPSVTVNYPTPDYGMVGAVTMDEQGFCNPKENAYINNEIEIVTIGDSFTWCTTVNPEDTWTYRLGERAGKSAYNLGSPGLGLYEYVQILKQFGLAKSPKLVILAVFEGNDLRNAVAYDTYRKTVQEAGDSFNAIPCYQNSFVCRAYRAFQTSFFGKYSYSLNLTLATMRWTKVQLTSKTDAASSLAENFHYQVSGAKPIPFNSENADLDEPRHAEMLRRGEISLGLFTDALKKFTKLASAHSFKPLVIYIPSSHTAYSAYTKFENPELKNLLAWFSETQRAFFREQSRAIGYSFLDLTETLQKASETHRDPKNLLYYPTNLHLTAPGHKVIANQLYSQLRTIYP